MRRRRDPPSVRNEHVNTLRTTGDQSPQLGRRRTAQDAARAQHCGPHVSLVGRRCTGDEEDSCGDRQQNVLANQAIDGGCADIICPPDLCAGDHAALTCRERSPPLARRGEYFPRRLTQILPRWVRWISTHERQCVGRRGRCCPRARRVQTHAPRPQRPPPRGEYFHHEATQILPTFDGEVRCGGG